MVYHARLHRPYPLQESGAHAHGLPLDPAPQERSSPCSPQPGLRTPSPACSSFPVRDIRCVGFGSGSWSDWGKQCCCLSGGRRRVAGVCGRTRKGAAELAGRNSGPEDSESSGQGPGGAGEPGPPPKERVRGADPARSVAAPSGKGCPSR